jgi:hypothetical protein
VQTTTLGPDTNNKVQTDLAAAIKIAASLWSCAPGYEYDGGSVALHATASNFFRGNAVGELAVTIAP